MGTSAYEKRGIAVNVPEWDPAKCVQCNQCAAICPHAAIRPIVMTEKEANAAPSALKSVQMKGKGFEKYQYAMAVSVLDCSGCQNCANVCPVPGSALKMQPIDTQRKKQRAFNYGIKVSVKEDLLKGPLTVKNSQFKQPLLEFSGACAGCGETPYAKLVTQLCGERTYIANATGCSSIWGGSTPSNPYTVNHNGHGPAWENSLFEDNAELGMGMEVAAKHIRERLSKEIATIENPAVQKAYAEWMKTYDNSASNAEPARKLIEALKASTDKKSRDILQYKEYLAKKVVWIFGGDGWAYDIGFSGLDHVLASGEDVNILVFDTEVYSNTGGQASKATPTAAVAQFAAGGKPIKKKNLAEIAMSYGYVYVAQVSMGYDLNQTVKALKEAEEYHGPSLVIAYSPCINHGIRGGMTDTQKVMKNAVTSGYWNTFRYNPTLIGTGKNPFQMDSKKPSQSYQDFIMNEVRYSSLARKFPDKAQAMYERSEQEAKERYDRWTKYSRLFEE